MFLLFKLTLQGLLAYTAIKNREKRENFIRQVKRPKLEAPVPDKGPLLSTYTPGDGILFARIDTDNFTVNDLDTVDRYLIKIVEEHGPISKVVIYLSDVYNLDPDKVGLLASILQKLIKKNMEVEVAGIPKNLDETSFSELLSKSLSPDDYSRILICPDELEAIPSMGFS